MPKRKKHPRLPNSFGSIRFLGKNRKNPYAVHPPCTEISEAGDYVRPKALCYVRDWYVGFSVLMSYHAGTYQQGTEEQLQQQREQSTADLDAFCRRILADFVSHSRIENENTGKTFSEVYEEFYEWKYGENAAKQFSDASKKSTRAAYKHCSSLYHRKINEITIDELQACINSCHSKEATLENIKSLFLQMYNFSLPRKYCDVPIGGYVVIPSSAEKDEHGISFSDADLATIWKHRNDNEIAEMLVIMCYSGMRINEYKITKVDLDNMQFIGGLKSEAGKNRVVPIHSAIMGLVVKRMQRYGELLPTKTATFRIHMTKYLLQIGITQKYTPHDCRHTFSALCERYRVNENDRKRMLGHGFGSDVTNAVYGHRTLEDLRREIEKIPAGF